MVKSVYSFIFIFFSLSDKNPKNGPDPKKQPVSREIHFPAKVRNAFHHLNPIHSDPKPNFLLILNKPKSQTWDYKYTTCTTQENTHETRRSQRDTDKRSRRRTWRRSDEEQTQETQKRKPATHTHSGKQIEQRRSRSDRNPTSTKLQEAPLKPVRPSKSKTKGHPLEPYKFIGER